MSVLNVIGFWLIPSYLFCLVILFFLVVINNGFERKFLLYFSLSICLAILLYLPVLVYLGTDTLLNNTLTRIYSPENYIQYFYNDMTSIYSKITPATGGIQIIIFVIFIGTIFFKKTKWISIGIVVLISLVIVLLGKHIPPRVFAFIIPIGALLFFGSIYTYISHYKSMLIISFFLVPLISWSFYKGDKFNYEDGFNDVPELVKYLKSNNTVGVISKIPIDYPTRYYLLRNNKIKSLWNTFGTDTIYVITNQFYYQYLESTFGEKCKGYQFSKIKKYNNSTLFLGIKK